MEGCKLANPHVIHISRVHGVVAAGSTLTDPASGRFDAPNAEFVAKVALLRSLMRPALARLAAVLLFLMGACVTPMTQMGTVSQEQIRDEQLKQQQLVIEADLLQAQRL